MMREMGPSGFSFDSIRQGLVSCDTSGVSSMYSDDADLQVIDNTRPPTNPTVFHGRSEISGYLKDVCGRDIVSHKIDEEVVGRDRVSFHESCRYGDGTEVLSANTLDLEGGKIKHHTVIQAWGNSKGR